jgi:putative PIN family toxin of toxin-antitoxin system
VVVDTNLLVGAAYRPGSASGRVVAACLAGELTALMSGALRRECVLIVGKAVRGRAFGETLRRFLEGAEVVEPPAVPRVVPLDPDDDKLIALAVAGAAEAVLTNDRHLLTLDPYGPVRILRPAEFLRAGRAG